MKESERNQEGIMCAKSVQREINFENKKGGRLHTEERERERERERGRERQREREREMCVCGVCVSKKAQWQHK